MKLPSAAQLFNLKDPVHILALGFFSGLSPKAPGTFGTLAAIPLFLLVSQLSLINFIALTCIMSLFGIWICGKSAEDAAVHDHPAIVWDEICGYFIAMIAIPVSWQSVLTAFVLFRIFDIFKPWPISLADKHCKGGFGIMIDDVLAGFATLACMHIIF